MHLGKMDCRGFAGRCKWPPAGEFDSTAVSGWLCLHTGKIGDCTQQVYPSYPKIHEPHNNVFMNYKVLFTR